MLGGLEYMRQAMTTRKVIPRIRSDHSMKFEEVDRKLIAYELLDFIDSARSQTW